MEDRNAIIRGPYLQRSIRARIEAFFLDNLGRVATREQLVEVATDPTTGRVPENLASTPVGAADGIRS